VRVLAEEGVTDISAYSVDPAYPAVLDFFLEEPISPNVVKSAFHAGK
jgi:citronellol/citronellal dehydrogenase